MNGVAKPLVLVKLYNSKFHRLFLRSRTKAVVLGKCVFSLPYDHVLPVGVSSAAVVSQV